MPTASTLFRVSPGRVAAAAVVVVLGGWAVWVGADRSRGWLHLRPDYATTFDAIVLDPPPPPEVRGGRETILARVRDRARPDETVRVLDQDLGDLGRLFAKYSPWVASVEGVRREYPNRLTVRLTFRVPVARLDVGDGSKFVGLTADGVVLPGEEIMPEVAKGLLLIARQQSAWDARPGRFLSPDERGQVAPEIASALRLARFLKTRDGASSRIASIHVDHGPGKLIAKTRRGTWVAWRNGPGEEADGEPSAEVKLERLARWEDANPAVVPGKSDLLRFTRENVELNRGEPGREGAADREGRADARPVEGKG